MKANDKLIISFLRENSRIQLTKISRKTKIPVSTLFEKLKRYKDGLIKKHTAIIDFQKLGYNTRAKVLLKANKEKLPELKDFLVKSPHTNELYKVNNGFDFMVEFIFRDMKQLEDYLDILCEKFIVQKEKVFYLVEELKREGFLSKPHLLQLGDPEANFK